jgi:hypothetical protein
MARTEFHDFVNVRAAVASPGPDSDVMIVERFQKKTFQVHGYQSGTYKLMGTCGDHDDWQDIPGCTGITANGFYVPVISGIELTLKKVKVVTTVDAGGPTQVPKVTFSGFDMRTDGA